MLFVEFSEGNETDLWAFFIFIFNTQKEKTQWQWNNFEHIYKWQVDRFFNLCISLGV